MFKQYVINPKKILESAKLSFSSLFRSTNIKSVAIPTVLFGGFVYNQMKKQMFTNKMKLAEQFRRLSLNDCENLEEGEMKELKYGTKDGESILVVKYDGKLRALSNYCPHYGAPMHTGVLIDNIVKCPWHGASFDVVTGETDISPSIDNLTTYEVFSDESGVYINLPEKVTDSLVPKMSKRDLNDKRKFVIIGGGPAGLSAAETLRQAGYTGEILILNKDKYVPYDRTVLSKSVPKSVNKIYLRSPDFLNDFDIDIRNEVGVSSVDNNNKILKLDDGSEISYDKLLIASGASAFVPNIPGVNLSHVVTLRSYDDMENIKQKASSAKNIVIVGASFVGMESAATLKKNYPSANIVVIERNPTAFYSTLGKEVGGALQKMHEDKGVLFILNKNLSEITSSSVKLDDGQTVSADLVLLGIGVSPNTQMIKDNLAMDRSYVLTDRYLTTSDENIFAAGDITSSPYFQTGVHITNGHIVNAQQQGAVAALNMLDNKVTYDYVPYFWSRQGDKAIYYTGTASNWDEVFVDGNLSDLKFVAYYIKDDKIVGFSSMGVPNSANIMYEAFRNNRLPKANLIKTGSANLETIKQGLKGAKPKCKRADCVCERRRAQANNNKI